MEDIKKKLDKNIASPKIMTAITNSTIRGIIRAANEENIKKEDIVSLFREHEQFILVYFR